MSKTFIQMVNLVHGKVRGPSGVSTLTADADTVLVAAMLNSAKDVVEASWKWHALRATVTFPSVSGTQSYDTSDSSVTDGADVVTTEQSELLYDPETDTPHLYDVTSGGAFQVQTCSRDYAVRYSRTSDGTNSASAPGLAAVYSNGSGLTVLFADVPSSVRNYSMEVYTPQAELTTTTDVITIPWKPLLDLTVAMVAEERGDLFGIPSQRFYDVYEDTLSRAIARDKDNAYDDAMIVI